MFDFIIITVQLFSFFISLRILTNKKIFTLKATCYIVLTAIISTILYPFISLGISLLLVLSIGWLCCRQLAYNKVKSIFLSTLLMLIAILSDNLTTIISFLTFQETAFENYILDLFHIPIAGVIMFIITYFFNKATKSIRSTINQNKKTQILLAILSSFILITFYGTILVSRMQEFHIDLIELNLMFLVIYLVIGLLVFYFYSKTLRERYEIQRNKDEQEILRKYTDEIEAQYTEIRKFKHDYQNILASLDDYIQSKDYDGLEAYYSNNIKPTSQIINQHQFELEPLSRIKIKEIKSILAMKLMMAQSVGININFEAKEEINRLPIESVVLVRALGIILDNAIEELTTLNYGILQVGVLKGDESTMFIIQNTCRENIERLHKLREVGFSTKGKDRGVGLNSLEEFARAHENMRIETSISKNQFIQKVIIGG